MRFLHISDLHWGKKLSPLYAYNLREFIRKEKFDSILITGDLTQRAKKREFISIKRYLDSLNTPYLAIPGNHDVPLYPVHLRFFAPYLRFKKFFKDELEPELITKNVCVFGLCSAHSFTSSEGRIKKSQVEILRKKLLRTSPSQKIIILIHHPIIYADPTDRDRTIWGAPLLIDLFNELPPHLILSGHYHHRFFYNLRDFYPKLSKDTYLFFTSTSTAERGRKKEEGRVGFNVIEIFEDIKIDRFISNGKNFINNESITLKGNYGREKTFAL
ncbi:MAG: metallophosphoesterase [Thermoanaerobaculia bacterium]